MQFVLKRLPVVVLAVLAMSAVAVSPAWAAESNCHVKAGSKKYGLCVAGNPASSAPVEWATTAPAEPFVETTNSTTWNGSPIDCKTIAGPSNAEFVASTESVLLKQGSVKMTGCKIGGKIGEKCSMPSELNWLETRGEFTRNDNLSVANVEGAERALFEFGLKDKHECLTQIFGSWKTVKGSYPCKLQEPEAEVVKHGMKCEGEGIEFSSSKAKIHYEASAALRGTDAGKSWRIYER